MSKTVYLKNGQSATLVKKIDEENYIVEPHIIMYDYDGDEYEERSDKIVVSTVYAKAPIELISNEYLEKLESVKHKTDELLNITKEVDKARLKLGEIEKRETDLSKFIIDRHQLIKAEKIAVFADRVEPYIMSNKHGKWLKINVSISVISGEEKGWMYQWYDDDESWGSSRYIDMEYGFLCDISEEELLKITKSRAIKYFADGEQEYELRRTDDKYLNEELILKKNEMLSKTKKNQLDEKREKICKMEKEVKDLKSELRQLK